ncbi:MAG: hypothetical protein ACI4E0_08180 [Blautia sp.]
MQLYQIGNLTIYIYDELYPLASTVFTEPFRITNEKDLQEKDAEILQLGICYKPLEAYTEFPLLYKATGYSVYETDMGNFMIRRWASCWNATGVYLKNNETMCYFAPEMKNQYKMNILNYFSAVNLHFLMLQHGAIVLHAACVDWNGQAVLFTAPSGTGKSTQAALWRQYAGTEIVNGDRVLVRQCEGHWYAFGYPCCGSSQICLNRTLPLRAVVVLQQGKENCVESLTTAQKFRSIVAGTELYPWHIEEVDCAFNIAETLIRDVSVIRLTCRQDENAVYTLQQYLEEEEYASGI